MLEVSELRSINGYDSTNDNNKILVINATESKIMRLGCYFNFNFNSNKFFLLNMFRKLVRKRKDFNDNHQTWSRAKLTLTPSLMHDLYGSDRYSSCPTNFGICLLKMAAITFFIKMSASLSSP